MKPRKLPKSKTARSNGCIAPQGKCAKPGSAEELYGNYRLPINNGCSVLLPTDDVIRDLDVKICLTFYKPTDLELCRKAYLIHFCDDDEIIVDSFWMNDRSELLTKSLWKSPYKPYAVLQPNLPEWYCTLSELMETACSADEVVDREASLVSTQANVIDSATVETDVVTIDVMQRHGAITDTANKTNLHTARELSTALEHSHPFDQLSTARSESTAISTTTSEDSNSSSSTM
ncbi:hypothetical protein Tcan_12937 [Toxocara canis]|uniref:Uncharacterized protein n=1 Tax=Toxocara canis TaxID=6265 RepID=A0A0B2VM63_TOXCA|nr:hypothetical protein Tcan_12937 [Toxocara canis]